MKRKDLTENSVQLWAEKVSWSTRSETKEMSKEQASDAIRMMYVEKELEKSRDEIIKDIDSGKGGFLLAVIYRRIAHFPGITYTMSISAMTLLASLCVTPGDSTILLALIQYKAWKNNVTFIDCNFLCCHVIPWGIYSPEKGTEFWRAQKIDLEIEDGNVSDNLLDYPGAYKSIATNNTKK